MFVEKYFRESVENGFNYLVSLESGVQINAFEKNYPVALVASQDKHLRVSIFQCFGAKGNVEIGYVKSALNSEDSFWKILLGDLSRPKPITILDLKEKNLPVDDSVIAELSDICYDLFGDFQTTYCIEWDKFFIKFEKVYVRGSTINAVKNGVVYQFHIQDYLITKITSYKFKT
ncbi:MAG: hypothetical protein CMM93_03085 [Rickettsiales bacterium]|nr:hypothetical protein [Rickettsiales bacterium]|tara:strand:+ start:1726 stop:2247 length:522 start_codon:yes stop_codon:yes gene_type:complete